MTAVPAEKRMRETVRLRGHTLLCLQGFRGKGYSPDFVENLAQIHRDLAETPDRLVQLVDEPDAVCGACPHQALSGCALNGEASEQAMQEQDRRVLALLGLQAGTVVRWREVLERISRSVHGDDLSGICGRCRWLPLGYCKEGIERLRKEKAFSDQPSALSQKLTADR